MSPSIAIRKASAKKYKAIGLLLLLLAFITQMTLLQRARDSSESWEKMEHFASNAYIAGLNYNIMFFAAGTATGETQGSILSKAAQENALSIAVRIGAANIEDKAEKVNKTLRAASSVKDLDSYNAYIAAVSSIDEELTRSAKDTLHSLQASESYSYLAYLCIYVLGSLLYLYGTWIED